MGRLPESSTEEVIDAKEGDLESLPGGVGARPAAGTALWTCVVALRNMVVWEERPAPIQSYNASHSTAITQLRGGVFNAEARQKCFVNNDGWSLSASAAPARVTP